MKRVLIASALALGMLLTAVSCKEAPKATSETSTSTTTVETTTETETTTTE